MDDAERKTLREHIVFLGQALERERRMASEKTRLLQRFMDPDDLGWAVTHEVRKLAYVILSNESFAQRDKENNK